MQLRFFRHSPFAARRKGQGLLETVVAFSVLLTGITTLMALVIMASIGRRSNEFQTVAANLAREGIESVAIKRNDNWMKGIAFDSGLSSGTDYTFVASFDPAALAWTYDFEPNSISDSLTRIYRYVSGANSGLMVQGTTATPQPADTAYSGYDRLVAADLICYDGSVETMAASGSTCGALTPGKIGLRVTSTVQWTEHNGVHSTSAVETFYDWR
jgi:hypothetical protein